MLPCRVNGAFRSAFSFLFSLRVFDCVSQKGEVWSGLVCLSAPNIKHKRSSKNSLSMRSLTKQRALFFCNNPTRPRAAISCFINNQSGKTEKRKGLFVRRGVNNKTSTNISFKHYRLYFRYLFFLTAAIMNTHIIIIIIF